jgi:hypothetical protein
MKWLSSRVLLSSFRMTAGYREKEGEGEGGRGRVSRSTNHNRSSEYDSSNWRLYCPLAVSPLESLCSYICTTWAKQTRRNLVFYAFLLALSHVYSECRFNLRLSTSFDIPLDV